MRFPITLLMLALALVPCLAQSTQDEGKKKALLRSLQEANRYFVDEKYKEAHAKYDDILKLYPENLEAQIGKMNVYLGEKKTTEATDFVNKAKGTVKTDSLEGLILGGVASLANKDSKGAAASFEAAVTQFPEKAYLAQYYLGYLQWRSRKLDDALPLLEKAVKLNPDYAETYYLLGDIYLAKKNKAKVVENWNAYLARVPAEGSRYERVTKTLKQL